MFTASLLSAVEFDLTGMPVRSWYLGRFKQSKFVKSVGFVVRKGEYGSLAMRKCVIDTAKYGTLKVKFSGKAWKSGKLYFSTGGKFFEAASVRGRMEDGMMVFNLHTNRHWKGTVVSFRLDILPQDEAEVVISGMKFYPADNSISLYNGRFSGKVSAELLLPDVGWAWRSDLTAPSQVKCEYLDIYGRTLKQEILSFSGGISSGKKSVPERTAMMRIDFGKAAAGW